MVGSNSARAANRRRLSRWSIGVALGLFLLGFGWLDQSEEAGLSFGERRRIVIVSDAGPVVVSGGKENRASHADSFLVRGPSVELATDEDEAVFRVRCDTAWPCRSTTTVEVEPGVELVVIATGGSVQVSSFEGDLTIFSAQNDVAMGSVSGSARVVSATGDVAGFGLELDQLTVEVDAAATDLQFDASPSSVVLTNERGDVDLVLPDTGYDLVVLAGEDLADQVDIGVDVDPSAGSTVSIRSGGSVTVASFEEATR